MWRTFCEYWRDAKHREGAQKVEGEKKERSKSRKKLVRNRKKTESNRRWQRWEVWGEGRV